MGLFQKFIFVISDSLSGLMVQKKRKVPIEMPWPKLNFNLLFGSCGEEVRGCGRGRLTSLLFILVGREKKGCGGGFGIRAGVHSPASQSCVSLGISLPGTLGSNASEGHVRRRLLTDVSRAEEVPQGAR